MDIMIEQYAKYSSELLDRHAPKTNIVVDRYACTESYSS